MLRTIVSQHWKKKRIVSHFNLDYTTMPRVNMYKYDDVVDLRIRRFIAKQLMNESEFLKKCHLS